MEKMQHFPRFRLTFPAFFNIFNIINNMAADRKAAKNAEFKFACDLITEVKEYVSIYGKADSAHSNRDKRIAIFDQIGAKLGKPGVECEKRWKSLRDTFLRNCGKGKSGDAGDSLEDSKVTWQFYDRMSFLKPFVYSRPTLSNCTRTKKRHQPLSDNTTSDDLDDGYDQQDAEEGTDINETQQDNTIEQVRELKNTPKQPLKKAKRRVEQTEFQAQVLDYLRSTNEVTEEDDDDLAMAAIGRHLYVYLNSRLIEDVCSMLKCTHQCLRDVH